MRTWILMPISQIRFTEPIQTGIRVNQYAITKGQGLANLQNLGFTLGTSFSPKKSDKTKPAATTTGLPDANVTEEQREFIRRNADMYVDFNVPWNLSLNYNFGLTKPGLSNATADPGD